EIIPYAEYFKQIGSGHHGRVYRISEESVIKIPQEFFMRGRNLKHYREGMNFLQKEYEIMSLLYEKGISVPQPRGMFEIKGLNHWGGSNRCSRIIHGVC
ncbi:MAG: hypothetical protein Q8P15_03485, partial [Nanoarchaeota archaeon]|nr:hypothetical protein [Nanoarchaeota archaeon]